MVPIQTKPCVTIAERIDRIRQRIYLEKISGVPAIDKEAFLERCQRYEQDDQAELPVSLHVYPDNAKSSPKRDRLDDWTDWTDWTDFAKHNSNARR